MFNGPNSSAGLEAFSSFTLTFPDDRGRPVRPRTGASACRLLALACRAAYRALFRQVERAAGSLALWYTLVLGISIVLVVDGVLMYLYRSANTIPNGDELPRAFVGLVTPIILAGALLVRRAVHAATDLVLRGQCAVCAYPIADLRPEPDGCTICPECGAAWRTRTERVRLRAYELSLTREGQGSPEDDWYRAERELETRLA